MDREYLRYVDELIDLLKKIRDISIEASDIAWELDMIELAEDIENISDQSISSLLDLLRLKEKVQP